MPLPKARRGKEYWIGDTDRHALSYDDGVIAEPRQQVARELSKSTVSKGPSRMQTDMPLLKQIHQTE